MMTSRIFALSLAAMTALPSIAVAQSMDTRKDDKTNTAISLASCIGGSQTESVYSSLRITRSGRALDLSVEMTTGHATVKVEDLAHDPQHPQSNKIFVPFVTTAYGTVNRTRLLGGVNASATLNGRKVDARHPLHVNKMISAFDFMMACQITLPTVGSSTWKELVGALDYGVTWLKPPVIALTKR